MQLDVGIEPPFRFAYIKYIDKESDMVNKIHRCPDKTEIKAIITQLPIIL